VKPHALREPEDVLTAVGWLLDATGRRPEPGAVVDLDPLFADLFLGSDIRQLDRVVAAAAQGHGWLAPVAGPGRRYALTPAGAARLRSVPGRLWRRLTRTQRVILVVVAVGAVLAAVLLTR